MISGNVDYGEVERAQDILRCKPGRSHAEWTCTEHSLACTSAFRRRADVHRTFSRTVGVYRTFFSDFANRTAEHHIIRFLKSRRYCGSFRFAVSSMAVGKNPPVQSAPLDLSRHAVAFLGAMVVHLPRTRKSGGVPIADPQINRIECKVNAIEVLHRCRASP